MLADPEPADALRDIVPERSIALRHACRPDAITDPLELKRAVPWIGFQVLEGLIGQRAHIVGQRLVEPPELARGEVPQSSRLSPAACSASDSSMSASSLPAATSASSSRSQTFQSYSMNHSRKLAYPAGERCFTMCWAARESACGGVMRRAGVAFLRLTGAALVFENARAFFIGSRMDLADLLMRAF